MTDNSTLFAEVWQVIAENVDDKKLNLVADDFIRAFENNGIDVLALEDIREIDNHIDEALEKLSEERKEENEEEVWEED